MCNPLCVMFAERTFSERGYYTDECFETYVDFLLDETKGGIPNDGRWRIMVLDGYGSHTCIPSVLRKFKMRRILLITMPSHTSHALQPLDVSCFKPTKYYFSWCLRYIYGTRNIQAVNKMEAPSYFELALSEACSSNTIKNGFRATGLFPFQKDFVATNPRMFHMADTLDPEKMHEKMFGPNANICVSDGYKLIQSTTAKVAQEMEAVGDVLKQQFPDLYASVEKLGQTHVNLELPLKDAAAIMRMPDMTKAKKSAPTRTNFIGETFHESRVLNREARIERIETKLAAIAVKKQEKAEAKAKKDAEASAVKQVANQKKEDKLEQERPVLDWLKAKGFATADVKTIGKAHILAAFQAHQEAITEAVRTGGDRITKSLSIKKLVELFRKYDVMSMDL